MCIYYLLSRGGPLRGFIRSNRTKTSLESLVYSWYTTKEFMDFQRILVRMLCSVIQRPFPRLITDRRYILDSLVLQYSSGTFLHNKCYQPWGVHSIFSQSRVRVSWSLFQKVVLSHRIVRIKSSLLTQRFRNKKTSLTDSLYCTPIHRVFTCEVSVVGIRVTVGTSRTLKRDEDLSRFGVGRFGEDKQVCCRSTVSRWNTLLTRYRCFYPHPFCRLL